MVIENLSLMANIPSSSSGKLGQIKLEEPDLEIAPKHMVSPYEKKYLALMRRVESVKQNNARLLNRVHYVKKLIRRTKKEKKFLMNRLDAYGDDYRTAFHAASAEVPYDSADSGAEASTSQQTFEPKIEVGL